MKQKSKVAILGGGGRTGKYIVTQLLDQGYSLKILLRHPDTFDIKNPLIEIIHGDAIDREAIDTLLKDCRAVISTVGQRKGEPLVFSQATMHVLHVMREYNIQRYILLTGLNVDTPFDKKSPETTQATDWMKTNYPTMHNEWQKAYALLTESDVDWTLVRVPYILFVDERREVKVNLEDCLGSK